MQNHDTPRLMLRTLPLLGFILRTQASALLLLSLGISVSAAASPAQWRDKIETAFGPDLSNPVLDEDLMALVEGLSAEFQSPNNPMIGPYRLFGSTCTPAKAAKPELWCKNDLILSRLVEAAQRTGKLRFPGNPNQFFGDLARLGLMQTYGSFIEICKEGCAGKIQRPLSPLLEAETTTPPPWGIFNQRFNQLIAKLVKYKHLTQPEVVENEKNFLLLWARHPALLDMTNYLNLFHAGILKWDGTTSHPLRFFRTSEPAVKAQEKLYQILTSTNRPHIEAIDQLDPTLDLTLGFRDISHSEEKNRRKTTLAEETYEALNADIGFSTHRPLRILDTLKTIEFILVMGLPQTRSPQFGAQLVIHSKLRLKELLLDRAGHLKSPHAPEFQNIFSDSSSGSVLYMEILRKILSAHNYGLINPDEFPIMEIINSISEVFESLSRTESTTAERAYMRRLLQIVNLPEPLFAEMAVSQFIAHLKDHVRNHQMKDLLQLWRRTTAVPVAGIEIISDDGPDEIFLSHTLQLDLGLGIPNTPEWQVQSVIVDHQSYRNFHRIKIQTQRRGVAWFRLYETTLLSLVGPSYREPLLLWARPLIH